MRGDLVNHVGPTAGHLRLVCGQTPLRLAAVAGPFLAPRENALQPDLAFAHARVLDEKPEKLFLGCGIRHADTPIHTGAVGEGDRTDRGSATSTTVKMEAYQWVPERETVTDLISPVILR